MNDWLLRQAKVNLLRRPDLHFVLPDCAVGAQFPTHAISALEAQGFTSIVDLRGEARPAHAELAKSGIAALHLRVPDMHAPTPQQFDTAVRWIEAELAEGGRVLVHCRAGVGRSVLTVCAMLVHQGLTPNDAFRRVRARRRVAAFSRVQWEALHAYGARQAALERPAPLGPLIGEQTAQLRLI
ncbi:MAG: dual specificity protein phosphatase family protein [Chloroflexi bacterium]|nr:dual specificity protein phosphatase family protein [Chloroflexota bacterium]